MPSKKTNKETLTATELKEIKKHLLKLKEEATDRLKNKKDMIQNRGTEQAEAHRKPKGEP